MIALKPEVDRKCLWNFSQNLEPITAELRAQDLHFGIKRMLAT